MLIDLIPAVSAAVEAWQEGAEDSGAFEVNDSELLVFSDASRREMQDTLVELSTAAGCVLEWRRDHDASVVRFTWRRLTEAS